MDSSFANAIGGAIDGLFKAVMIGIILIGVLLVTCIGMGIYIYVH